MTGHMSELETDHGVVDELLAKSSTFVCIFDAFFVADAGETKTLDDYTNSFVVEVRHDNYSIVNNLPTWWRRGNIPLNPWFSFPIRFSTGTFTSSNVMYVVPEDQTP